LDIYQFRICHSGYQVKKLRARGFMDSRDTPSLGSILVLF